MIAWLFRLARKSLWCCGTALSMRSQSSPGSISLIARLVMPSARQRLSAAHAFADEETHGLFVAVDRHLEDLFMIAHEARHVGPLVAQLVDEVDDLAR